MNELRGEEVMLFLLGLKLWLNVWMRWNFQ
jgi:hypothetical protein